MRTRGGQERAARPDLKVWKRREVRAAVEVNMEAGEGREVAKAKIEEAQKGETKKSDLEKEREVNQAIAESKRESKNPEEKEAAAVVAAAAAAVVVILVEAVLQVQAEKEREAAAQSREVEAAKKGKVKAAAAAEGEVKVK